jgi:hypothetical protein
MFNIKQVAGRAGYGCVAAMVAVLWMSPASAGNHRATLVEQTTADATEPPVMDEGNVDPAQDPLPPVLNETDDGMQQPADSASDAREDVKKKIALLRAEAKAKLIALVAAKAAEFEQRVKDKIKNKIEAANQEDDGDAAPVDAQAFRKTTHKRILRHH